MRPKSADRAYINCRILTFGARRAIDIAMLIRADLWMRKKILRKRLMTILDTNHTTTGNVKVESQKTRMRWSTEWCGSERSRFSISFPIMGNTRLTYVVIPDPHRGSINEIAKLREHCPVVVPPQAEFATAMIDTENRGCQSYSTESGGSGLRQRVID